MFRIFITISWDRNVAKLEQYSLPNCTEYRNVVLKKKVELTLLCTYLPTSTVIRLTYFRNMGKL